MITHPAKLMVFVWGASLLAFVFLPFQMVGNQLSIAGFATLALFLMAFFAGTAFAPNRSPIVRPTLPVSARRAQHVLMAASVVTIVCIVMDLRDKNVFDLQLAYELRSASADALLYSDASISSAWFQVAFLTYPAAFVFSVVHCLYSPRLSVWRLLIFGVLPVGLTTLAMGGRFPILYGALVIVLAYRQRTRSASADSTSLIPISARTKWLFAGGGLLLLFAMVYYFAVVFMVRAQVAGGAEEMFAVAEDRWGVAFRGLLAGPMLAVMGPDATYLVFVSIWYAIQGVAMSNFIFSGYDGPSQFGVYGLDLVSAIMRRIDPERVAAGFDALLSLGTYGFLPSSFGSLFVDFGYLGIVACLIWGYLAALAYRRIARDRDQRWFMWGPFVSLGIAFSIINTPLGFTNGLVTHLWAMLAFLLLVRARTASA